MGKRYKKGNKGRKRKKTPIHIFKENQRKLNQKIQKFRRIVFYDNLNTIESYKESDKLRREIKSLLNNQSKHLTQQPPISRFIHYDQTANFKGLYVTWKKITLPTYLNVRFQIPEHLIPTLTYYYRDVKRGCEPSLKIF